MKGKAGSHKTQIQSIKCKILAMAFISLEQNLCGLHFYNTKVATVQKTPLA